MAAGDLFQVGPTSLDTGVTLSIQPAVGVEWVIHNVYTPANIAINYQYYDGTNATTFDSDAVDGTRYMVNWHASSGVYVRVKNVSTSTGIFVSADGMVTK
jgi:hypothetical protein